MKTYLLLSAVLCSQVHAAGEGFVNFVRQTQQSTGVVWSMPVTPQGAAPSQLSLETNGALFQLWTIEQATAKEYLLDQKLVGAYLPSGSVSIKTLDPYSAVPRTRADQPFTVTVNVSGLLAGAGLPAAATKVLLEHHLAPYPAGQTSISAAQAISGTPLSSAYITQNGNTVLNFATTNLKAADLTKVSGEEHFVVHALSDGTLTQTQLATAKIQIWPVTSGTIQGIKANEKIRFHAPMITPTYTDVYPGSDIWLQVYEGAAKLGTQGILIVGSSWTNTNATSKSIIMPPIANYDDLFKKDGTYTIELLSRTPFGLERLDHVTFSIDRQLSVRAHLGSLDNQ